MSGPTPTPGEVTEQDPQPPATPTPPGEQAPAQDLPDGFAVKDGVLLYKGKPFDPVKAVETIKAQRTDVKEVQQELKSWRQRAEAAEQALLQSKADVSQAHAQLQTSYTELQQAHARVSADLASAKATISEQGARLQSLTATATQWLDEQTKDWPEAVKKTYVGSEDDIPARLAWAKAMSAVMAEQAADPQPPPAGGSRSGPPAVVKDAKRPTGSGNARIVRRF